MNLSEIKMKLDSKEKFGRVTRRIKKNETVASYYEQLSEERADEVLKRTAKNLRDCCQYWDINYYRLQDVKDVLHTNLCKNTFCENCQNSLSIQRERKYAPLLDELARTYDVYHIVFTVPNCAGNDLCATVENMYKQFAYVVRLFTGNAKIKGYDFAQYGFLGAVRALEITKSKARGDFHPHFHCLFVVRKGLRLDENRKHINSYSFNNPDVEKKSHKKRTEWKPERYFGDFEILLQKVWRLRVDGVKVTRKSLEDLREGYSVICDNADGKYKQVFKYVTKGIFTKDEESALNGYADFVVLRDTLYRRKVIQGYGLLNKFKFEANIEQDARTDQEYLEIVKTLHELENPERVFEFLSEIVGEIEKKNITYISRSTIAEILGADYGE